MVRAGNCLARRRVRLEAKRCRLGLLHTSFIPYFLTPTITQFLSLSMMPKVV